MSNNSRPVFSSEKGRLCPGCGEAMAACVCAKKKVSSATDGIVRVRRETKGRGGKTVTVITGLPLEEEELKTLAGELKRRCSTGGTLKDGVVEIQGDHADLLVSELQKRGYTVKRSGG